MLPTLVWASVSAMPKNRNTERMMNSATEVWRKFAFAVGKRADLAHLRAFCPMKVVLVDVINEVVVVKKIRWGRKRAPTPGKNSI